MTSSLDFGRKILMKRMIQSLEAEGYRVEFAEDYNGYIVAGQGEDPAVMLLDADAIDGLRRRNPGSAGAFVGAVLEHVQSQISSQGSQSIQPVTEEAEAVDYADVPSDPPEAVGFEEDMVVDEEPVESPAGEEDELPDFDEGGGDFAAEEPPAADEQQRMEDEVTEQLTVEDLDDQ